MTYEGLLYAVILTSAVLVLFDAKALGARRGGLGGGLLDMGFVGWFLACLLLWIIAFPCYLVKRPRLVRAHALATAARYQTSIVPFVPAPSPQPYSREYAEAYGLPWTEPQQVLGQPPSALAPAPVDVPSSRRFRLTGVAAMITVAVLVVPAAAQYERAQSSADRTAVGTATDAPAVRPAPVPIDLSRITLRSTDFHNGYRVRLAPAGEQMVGHATLDNCGFDFTTEAARVARRNVEVVDAHGQNGGIADEVVAYRTAADAASALRQWNEAAGHCRRTPFPSASVGGAIVTERIVRHQIDLGTLPVPSNTLTIEDVTPQDSSTLHLVAVLQRRGRLLDVIYVRLLAPPTPRVIRLVENIASDTGRRLAAQ